MNVLFFIGDADWTARARIFTAAAHGLAARGHEVSVACPPGTIIDRLDSKAVGVVRVDPSAGTAVGAYDLRRVAQERSLDIAFVHTAREQFMVGSGLRFARGGTVLRRFGMFEPRNDDAGMIAARLAPARPIVTTNAEAAKMINAGMAPPVVVPLGVDTALADAAAPADRRSLRLREDAIVVACPYAPNGRVRLLNMMRTLSLVAPRHPRLRAVVYGQRATDDDLRMQAAALGVAPLVQFVDGNAIDPLSLMKASDFVWLASDHDAAAVGCLDAMAVGRPVISERSQAIEYFIADGINGTVLPEGEPATVAAAVASVIARGDARAAFGQAGRMRVQREFGLQAMIDGFDRAAQAARQAVAAR